VLRHHDRRVQLGRQAGEDHTDRVEAAPRGADRDQCAQVTAQRILR
jgi:hypothetical protein